VKRQLAVNEICLISIFTAMTAVTAQIAIPLPFTPIPISFGMVGIYITGMLLKPSHAVLAQICYLLLGSVGAPVFANFRGGFAALIGPTGGCLMTYPFMAALISFTLNSRHSLRAEKGQGKIALYLKTGAALCLALCAEYFGGASWLAATTGTSLDAALGLICYPFIPLDAVKIIFCVFALLPFRARLIGMRLLLLDGHHTIHTT
jgi:biotin transport system substrate-specific component